MRLYGRGIRRRLAPMLGGDRQRIELAYALQFSLSGTPAIRYGEEIGMGEDLALRGPRRLPHPHAVGRPATAPASPGRTPTSSCAPSSTTASSGTGP